MGLTLDSVPGFTLHEQTIWHIVKNSSSEKQRFSAMGPAKKGENRERYQILLPCILCGCGPFYTAFGEIDLLAASFTDMLFIEFV